MSLWVRWGMRAALAPPLLSLFLAAATAAPPDRAAYVVGANDASVTRVDLDSGVVTSNLLSVGSVVNRIEVDDLQTWAVAVNSGSDDLTVIDLLGESVLGTVPLPAGANPWAAEIHAGRAYVTALLHDRVYSVDPLGGTVFGSVDVGTAPEGMAVANGHLYVANTGFDFGTFSYEPGTVSVIDLDSFSVVATVPVNLNPQECVLSSEGNVHVVCTGDFGTTLGAVDVIDPVSNTVTASLPVNGYPGGASVSGPRVFLNVTTPSFASEIRGYHAPLLTWIWDESSPLLPSFDFYGNLRTTTLGQLAVCSFSGDLLLLEDPDAPGSPDAFLVGDGPSDVILVERSGPVPLLFSGVSAIAEDAGVRLTWFGTPEAGVASFRVDRGVTTRRWERVADELRPARQNRWFDASAPADGTVYYRIAAVHDDGRETWSAPVHVDRGAPRDARLAIQRVSPNPGRDVQTIEFVAPRAGDAWLQWFDVRGSRVASLPLTVSEGAGTFVWNGRDERGRTLAPGAYFLRLTVDGSAAVSRVLRLR